MRLFKSSNCCRSVVPCLAGRRLIEQLVGRGRARPLGKLLGQIVRQADEMLVVGHGALSQRMSIKAPTPGSSSEKTAIRPVDVARSACFSWTFLPRIRSHSIAPCMSPLASVRAFLQSIMGRPVFSRSSFTAAAVISAMVSISLSQVGPFCRKGLMCDDVVKTKSFPAILSTIVPPGRKDLQAAALTFWPAVDCTASQNHATLYWKGRRSPDPRSGSSHGDRRLGGRRRRPRSAPASPRRPGFCRQSRRRPGVARSVRSSECCRHCPE